MALQAADFLIRISIAFLLILLNILNMLQQRQAATVMTQPLGPRSSVSASSSAPADPQLQERNASDPMQVAEPRAKEEKIVTAEDRLHVPAAGKAKSGEKRPSPLLSECFYVVPAALPLSCVTSWGTKEDRTRAALAHQRKTLTMTLFYNLSKLLSPLTEEVQVVMAFDCGTQSFSIRTRIITMDELLAGQTTITLDETEIDQALHHLSMMDGPESVKGYIHHPAGILKLSIFHKARNLETVVEASESENQSTSSDSKGGEQSQLDEEEEKPEPVDPPRLPSAPLEPPHQYRQSSTRPNVKIQSSGLTSGAAGANANKLQSIQEGDEESSSQLSAKIKLQEDPAPEPIPPTHTTHETKGPQLHTVLTEWVCESQPPLADYKDEDPKSSNDSSSLAGGEDIVSLLHLIKGELKGRDSCLRLLANINVLVLPMDAAIEVQRYYEMMILSAKHGAKEPCEYPPKEQKWPESPPKAKEQAKEAKAAKDYSSAAPCDFFDSLRHPRPRFTIVRTKHAPPRGNPSPSGHVQGSGRWADGWERQGGHKEGTSSARDLSPGYSSLASGSVPAVSYSAQNPIIELDPDFDYEAFMTQEKALLAAEISAARSLPGLTFQKFKSAHALVYHRSIKPMDEDVRTLFLASSRNLSEASSLGVRKTNSLPKTGSNAGPSASGSEEQLMAEKAAKIFGPDLMQFLAHHEMWALFHLVMEWHYWAKILVLKHEGLSCPPQITSTYLAKEFCSSQGLLPPPELTDRGQEPRRTGDWAGWKSINKEMLDRSRPPHAPRPRT